MCCSAALSAGVEPAGEQQRDSRNAASWVMCPVLPLLEIGPQELEWRPVWSPSEQFALMNVHVLWKACHQAVQQQVKFKEFHMYFKICIFFGGWIWNTFRKYSNGWIFCSAEERSSLQFPTTWGSSQLSFVYTGKNSSFLEVTIFLLPNF